MYKLNYNLYQKATNQLVISGTNEQVLSGQEYNITSQIPYMPWSTFNFQGYRMENEKTTQDVKGNIYSLEMALNPSLQFDILNLLTHYAKKALSLFVPSKTSFGLALLLTVIVLFVS